MKHLERLRKMIGLGIKLEWPERDPFQQYQLKFQRVERGYLTDEELSVIEKRTFSIERLQMVKNMFVFACYTGLSYSDLIKLKPENIQIGIDGESWIKTNRQKTKTPVTLLFYLKLWSLSSNTKMILGLILPELFFLVSPTRN
jgi:integrase